MSTQMKLRRGTTAQVDAFTPVEAEVVVDTTRDQLRLGDGVKAGGIYIPNALDVQQQSFLFGTVGGTADAITLTNIPPLATLVAGVRLVFKATANNTGATTINADGTGVKDFKKLSGGALVAFDADDLVNGGIYTADYDGTQFQLGGGVGAAGGLTSISNVAITAITNIDVTGFLPGTYDNYEVWISNGQPVNDGSILEMETSTDGGSIFDVGTSDYTWAGHLGDEGGANQGNGDPDDSEIQLTLSAANVGNAANENVSGRINIFTPEATEFSAFTWSLVYRTGVSLLTTVSGFAERQSAADVNALRFHWGTGNWVAQGDIQFLGIKQ